jgi:hypothetical protein
MPSDRHIIDGVEHIVTSTAGTPEKPVATPISGLRKKRKKT